MLSDPAESEFQELLRRAGIPVPEEELPRLRDQFEQVQRHIRVVDEAAALVAGTEPGFLFKAEGRE